MQLVSVLCSPASSIPTVPSTYKFPKNACKMHLRSSSHAFTKLIQMRHTHVKWPHLHLNEPVEEFKKTRDSMYGMAIIRFIILLLLILYDPGFACHSDNFMSLVLV